MCKRTGGYFTVEAVYLIPIILFLYGLIIVSGFYLYDRCVISQDCYLLAFRAGHFTDSGENYGEIIYADMTEELDEEYVRARFLTRARLYPYFGEGKMRVNLQNEIITVSMSGFDGLLHMSKSIPRHNPFRIIKNVRRECNGSKIP